jgi:hypothetical protein
LEEKGQDMNHKLGGRGLYNWLLGFALMVWGASAAMGAGASLWHSTKGGAPWALLSPIAISQTGDEYWLQVVYPGNAGDIIRVNPDGSGWIHNAANTANYAIWRLLRIPTGDGDWTYAWADTPDYTGTGSIDLTASGFAVPPFFVPDWQDANWNLDAKVKNSKGQQFKISIKILIKGGRVLKDQEGFPPLP